MKQIALILLTLFGLSSNAQVSGGITIGLYGSTVNQKGLADWAPAYSSYVSFDNELKVPKIQFGPTIGFELYRDHFNTGINWVWSRRQTTIDDTNLYGDPITQTLKIKYHHFEMPFFLFPGGGLLGVGFTIDAGKHKVFVLNTVEDKGVTPMKNWQLGSKFGLKFRSSREGFSIGGMLYYQVGIFKGELTDWQNIYPYRPNSIGFRLNINLFAK